MTIFVTQQLRVTANCIRNSCDVVLGLLKMKYFLLLLSIFDLEITILSLLLNGTINLVGGLQIFLQGAGLANDVGSSVVRILVFLLALEYRCHYCRFR